MSKEILEELAAWREDGGTAEDQMLHKCYVAIKQLKQERDAYKGTRDRALKQLHGEKVHRREREATWEAEFDLTAAWQARATKAEAELETLKEVARAVRKDALYLIMEDAWKVNGEAFVLMCDTLDGR